DDFNPTPCVEVWERDFMRKHVMSKEKSDSRNSVDVQKKRVWNRRDYERRKDERKLAASDRYLNARDQKAQAYGEHAASIRPRIKAKSLRTVFPQFLSATLPEERKAEIEANVKVQMMMTEMRMKAKRKKKESIPKTMERVEGAPHYRHYLPL